MKLRTLFLALASLMIISTISFAQGEVSEGGGTNQGGIGFQVGGASSFGGHAFYNISPDARIGSHIGFIFDGGDEYVKSTYAILFAPYFNYYMMKMYSFSFFMQACFLINTGTYSSYNYNTAEWEVESRTSTEFNINVGGEWFPTKGRTISVYGGINFLNINLDPFRFRVGTGGPFVGINWVIF